MTANVFNGTVEVIARGLQFPEGPAFAQDGTLWLVELKGECLVQYDNGYLKRFHVGGAPNGIAIDSNNKICFCDAARNQVRLFDPLMQQTSVIADQVEGEELTKPNDLAFDKKGNLVFTCPGESRKEPTGYACVLMNDGSVKKITTEKYFPNGLAFSADGKSLVIAETYQHRLWMGDWDTENGVWTNEKPWCAIGGPDGPGGPDGMAFDKNENLYVAVYGTSSIRVANKEGMLIDEIPLPAKNPTNCAFDPSGKLGLVVTEAEKGILLSIKKDNF